MLKKILKVAIILLICLVILVGVLLIYLSNKQCVPNNYHEVVNTGGDIEAKYLARGEYDVAYIEASVMENFRKYEIWYPSAIETEEDKYPVVVFNNGTGVKASKYQSVLKHLASWGFVVIATEEEYSWNGFSSEMCVRFLIKCNENELISNWERNPFYGRLDLDNVGVSGHSQGGTGVMNAITITEHASMYKAAFAVSTPNLELAKNLEWDYDVSTINIPILMVAGTGSIDSETISPLNGMQEIYNAIPSDTKLVARRNDGDHGDMLYFNDGYMTAFFLWQLKGDTEAAKAFEGNNAEILDNTYYQDIEKNY